MEGMKDKLKTNQKGITLVALALTVIVLMILATVIITRLGSEDGVIEEAQNAAIQTEVSKLSESTEMYIKNKETARLKNKNYETPSTLEDLQGTVTEVTTAEGIVLGVYNNFNGLEFLTDYGKGGKNIDSSWNQSILELNDTFAINPKTSEVYYIDKGQIWRAGGITTADEIIKRTNEYENQNSGSQPSASPTSSPSTNPSTSPSTDPTTKPSTEPSTDPSPADPEKQKHTVTYDYESNGGNNISGSEKTVEVQEGETVSLSPTATKDGDWEFVGWSQTQESHEKEQGEVKMGEQDITLYAIFKKELSATFNSQNAQNQEKVTGEIYNNETQTTITPPTLTEVNKEQKTYVGKGWTTTEEANEATEVEVEAGGSVTLQDSVPEPKYYAIYAVKEGTGDKQDETSITFHYWNGEQDTTEVLGIRDRLNYKGEPIAVPTIEVPAKVKQSTGPESTVYKTVVTTPKVLVGEETGELTPSITLENNEYYTIYYKTVNITTHEHGEGDAGGKKEQKEMLGYHDGTVKTADFELPTATSVSVESDKSAEPRHWSTDPDAKSAAPSTGGPDAKNETAVENGETVHLTADNTYYMSYTYTMNIKTITLNSEDPTTQTVYLAYNGDKKGNTVEDLDKPSNPDDKTNFIGWETESTPSANVLSGETILDEQQTYYATYSKKIEVTRNIYNNTHPEDDPLTQTTYKNKNITVPVPIDLGTADNITDYQDDGASPPAQVEATFRGWIQKVGEEEPGPEGKVEEHPEAVQLTDDATYNASYSFKRTIQGEPTKEQTVYLGPDGTTEEGATVVTGQPSPPTGDDWELAGWTQSGNLEDLGDNPEEKIVPEDEITPEMELHPLWKRKITITKWTYDDDNPTKGKSEQLAKQPTVYSNGTQYKGETVELGTDEVSHGSYTPRGWSTKPEANATQDFIDVTQDETGKTAELTDDTEFFMSYKYTVTVTFYYNNNGGISQTPDAYMNYKQEKIGATITVPEDQTADTWTFKGWSTNESYTNLENVLTKAQIPTTATENATYYALFEKDVTVTRYEYNGKTDTQTGQAYRDYTNEEHGYPIELSSLDGATLPDNCTKLGWKKDVSTASSSADEDVGNSVSLVTNASYYMLYTKTIYIGYKDSDGNALDDIVESTSGTAYTNYNLLSTIAGTAPKLSSKIPTKEGFEFLGWNTSENQSTATYSTTDCTNQKAITGRTEDLQLYAVWKEKIDPNKPESNFDVNVTVTNFGTIAGISTWYPFAYDGTNYYIIAGEYYNSSQGLPSGLSKSSNSSFPYGVYISSNSGSAPETSDKTKELHEGYTEGFWRRYNLSVTAQYNTRFCQRLLDTSFWKSKFSSTYTDDAIGSPTAEMLKMAWEARGGSTITLTSGTNGYSASGSVGTSDKTFNIGGIPGRCNDYWLASPGLSIYNGCYISSGNGFINSSDYFTDNSASNIGLRPVVKLKSTYKITKSGSNYEITQ